MISEAIDNIRQLAERGSKPLTTDIATVDAYGGEFHAPFRVVPEGSAYKLGDAIKPFYPVPLELRTLTGFVDAFNAGYRKFSDLLIHVVDPFTVALISKTVDSFGLRRTYLTAKYLSPGTFVFDDYQASEKFLIGLETCFLRIDGDSTDYVKTIASNLKAGDTVHAQDDGINQIVTLKTGAIDTAEVKLNPRVKLTPIRTFTEAAPVENEFLLRLRPGGNGLPTVALFNLNGLRWQSEAMQAIKRWLDNEINGGLTDKGNEQALVPLLA